MNKKINITTKSLCVILGVISLSIFTLTIAYAALSTTLNISGNAQVNASTWDFYLAQGSAEGISNSTKDGYITFGTATTQTPTFNGTTMTYNLSLTKPGDSVLYAFNIINNGTINGEIDSIIHSTPTCTSATGNKVDEELVCNNLIYEIGYLNGNFYNTFYPISQGDVISTLEENNAICSNGDIKGMGNRTTLLRITLDNNMSEIPSSTVTISNLKTTINILQTEKECSAVGAGEK